MVYRKPAQERPSSGLDPEAYDAALAAAARTVELRPDHVTALNTLGVAQFRSGRYRACLATLDDCDRRRVEAGMDRLPEDWAFIAMARQALGLTEEARAALERLQEIMREPSMADDPESRAFLREAEDSLAAD